MARKVTLYIDDSRLRLLVGQGRRIKGWASLPLEPGLVKNNVIINGGEVSARIKGLFRAQKVRTRKVLVGISGLHCLSRPMVLPPLPKEVLGEVVTREAKKLLPVPLEKLYLSWQIIPAAAGKTMVFLAAVPRDTVDTTVRTLRQAGLQPYFLGLKPLLLAKLLNVPTGIIVDVQNNEFDVVIVAEGMPQPVRTVSFANEALTWQEKLPIIVSDAERTIAFFNANNPGKVLAADVPIFASGELCNEQELCQTLAGKTGHPVIPLAAPMEHSGDFVSGPYTVNIALALPGAGKDAGLSPVSLNTLPAVYRPKGVSLTRVLAIPAAVVLAGLILTVAIIMQSSAAGVALVKSELTRAEQLLQQRMLQKQELDAGNGGMEKRLSEIKDEISRFTAAIGSLEMKTRGLNSDLKIVMEALPGTTTVKRLTHAGNLLTIEGLAPDEKELLAYVGKLGASGVFADVTVTTLSRSQNGSGIDFTLLGNHEGQKIAASSLEIVINNLPPDVNIMQVSYGKGTMSLSARTAVQDSMLAYVRRLEQSGRFSDIIVNEMTKTDPNKTDFNLILKIGE